MWLVVAKVMITMEARENVTDRGVAEEEKEEKMLGRGVVTANKVHIILNED